MKLSNLQITRMWGWWPMGDFGPLTFYTSHRRKVVVAFVKAPPKSPPTWKQRLNHTRWKNCIHLWNLLTPANRADWTEAATRARLAITGYNFWMYTHMTGDRAAALTVQRQSGVDLNV